MKLVYLIFNFSKLDAQIQKLRELRDSYRQANIEYYGEHLAKMLDE